MKASFWLRGGVLLLLAGLSMGVMRPLSLYYYGLNPGPMHGVDLVFHEAGHVLLMWAPRLIYVMGGTLGQLGMPLALVLAFSLNNRWFDACACGWWFGQSLADCAPYVADARALRLPLITGYTGAEAEGHDWEYILGQLNASQHDALIAASFLNTGRLIMVVALLAALAIALWDHFSGKRRPVSA